MKKKTRKVILIIGIIILLIVAFSVFNKKSYQLNLPDVKKIVSIGISLKGTSKFVSSEKDINSIYDIIKSNGRKTTENVKDINTLTDAIKINLNYENSVATSLYIYTKDDKYYLLQLNNGNYEITKDEYDQLCKYVK